MREKLNDIPLSFEVNAGQASSPAKFISRGNAFTALFTPTQIVIEFDGAKSKSVLRMRPVRATSSPRVLGWNELDGKNNYFIGNDRTKWRAKIPTYSSVKYEGIYPGVDLVFYGNRRQLEYDLIVAPGADPEAIRLAFDGAERIRVDAGGDLILQTSSCEFRQHKPIIYQESNGVRREIAGGYAITNNRVVGFRLGYYDKDEPVIIDPVLSYSTFLGGRSSDEGLGIAVDSAGSAYVVGRTLSFNFPTTSGALQPSYSGGLYHAFVIKLNSEGNSIDYSTYLGGAKNSGDTGDQGFAIAVDSSGNAHVTGMTTSDDFPATAGALQSAKPGPASAFVSKLDPSGSKLVYSTYLGGGRTIFGRFGRDFGAGIAVDTLGNAYVAGSTTSINFPTANALQPAYAGGATDAFVAKLNPAGTALVYSTYFGGSGDDRATGIAVDSAGSAYVEGITSSADLRTTASAFQPQSAGASDGFVLKLEAAGATLLYCTYLGGSGADQPAGIAVDSSGNAFITGSTSSTDFPTANSFQSANHSGPAFKSTDVGISWRTFNVGLTAGAVNSLAVDPKVTSTLYAGTDRGVFKSTDAGTTWNAVNNGLTKRDVRALAIDAKDPLIVYAGAFAGGAFKTTDGGSSWSSTSLPSITINAFAISPALPSTIYAGGVPNLGYPNGGPPPIPGLFKSTDGGSSWLRFNTQTFFYYTVLSLAIDPANALIVYASTTDAVFKTTDGGATWIEMNKGLPKNPFPQALVLDPSNPSVLYVSVATFDLDTGRTDALYRTTDGANSWIPTSLVKAKLAVVDPVSSSTVYGITDVGVFRSTNYGSSWKLVSTAINSSIVNNAVIDPANTLTFYAGGRTGFDAFVTKLNRTGSGLIYSTYFGGSADDSGASVAVDARGNAYVTGETSSEDFPVANAFKQTISPGEFTGDAFVIKLSNSGAVLGYSTYLGGAGIDGGSGIAVDSVGNAYITGFTASDEFPTVNALQKRNAGGNLDAFIAKLSLPIIISIELSRKKLIVRGQGFDRGAVILVDGEAQKTHNDESNPTSALIANKAGRSIAPGQKVTIQVRNSDGTLSEAFNFTLGLVK